jgi:hypothetical protein
MAECREAVQLLHCALGKLRSLLPAHCDGNTQSQNISAAPWAHICTPCCSIPHHVAPAPSLCLPAPPSPVALQGHDQECH